MWSFAGGGKLFVYQNSILMLGYAYGYFQGRDLLKVGGILTLVEGLFLLLVVPLYWPLIGVPWRTTPAVPSYASAALVPPTPDALRGLAEWHRARDHAGASYGAAAHSWAWRAPMETLPASTDGGVPPTPPALETRAQTWRRAARWPGGMPRGGTAVWRSTPWRGGGGSTWEGMRLITGGSPRAWQARRGQGKRPASL
jgi:hypothetical protein